MSRGSIATLMLFGTVILSACILAPVLYGSSRMQIGALGLICGVAALLLAYHRVRRFGIADALAVFAFCFVAYNALVPLQIAILGGKEQLQYLYPVSFGEETYLASAA